MITFAACLLLTLTVLCCFEVRHAVRTDYPGIAWAIYGVAVAAAVGSGILFAAAI